MQQAISNLSAERLEAEISSYYDEGFRLAPGVPIKEVGVLEALWAEFDRRFEEGLISKDTDWEPRRDWEDE